METIISFLQTLQNPVPMWMLLAFFVLYAADRILTVYLPIIHQVRREKKQDKIRERERRRARLDRIKRKSNIGLQLRRLKEHNENIPPPL